MALRVVVWGTGNVGRPAIRAVISHAHLDLAGVIVAIEGDAPDCDLLMRSVDGKLRLIPYRSVVQMIAARDDFEPTMVE